MSRAVQVSPYTCLLGEKHDPAELVLGYNSEDLVSSSVSDLKHYCHRQILPPFYASLS